MTEIIVLRKLREENESLRPAKHREATKIPDSIYRKNNLIYVFNFPYTYHLRIMKK